MRAFYAYMHIRPDFEGINSIFYVGKGVGGRAYDFEGNRNNHYKHIVAKCGKQNVSVRIIECSSEQMALDLEIRLIKALRHRGANICNLTDGGEGISGYRHTDEAKAVMSTVRKGRKHKDSTKQKMSEKRVGEKNAFFGKAHTEESKAKIADSKIGTVGPWLGKARSDETKKRISEALMGRPGRKHTEEAKQKISSKQKGRKQKPVTEDTRRKLSEATRISWIQRKLKMKEA